MMIRVFLHSPFSHHYAGTIFEIDDSGVFKSLKDIPVFEKVPPDHNLKYDLPDDGAGAQIGLPIRYTSKCPEDLFFGMDEKSGPCRITSVSEGLKVRSRDPRYNLPIPTGYGKINLLNSGIYPKNQIHIDCEFDSAVLTNRQTVQFSPLQKQTWGEVDLDFSELQPGFYHVDLIREHGLHESFTFIKWFPVYVAEFTNSRIIRLAKTIW